MDCLIKTLQRKTQWEKNLSEEKRVQSAHILQSIYSPLWVCRSLIVNEKIFMVTHANIMNNLLECLSCHLIVSAWHQYHTLLELICIKEFLVRCVCFMNCYIFVHLINFHTIAVLSQVNSILFLIVLWSESERYHASVFPINCGFDL